MGTVRNGLRRRRVLDAQVLPKPIDDRNEIPEDAHPIAAAMYASRDALAGTLSKPRELYRHMCHDSLRSPRHYTACLTKAPLLAE